MKHLLHLPLPAMLLLTILSAPSSVSAQTRAKKESTAGQTTVSGLIIPRDDNGLYVRTRDGQYEIEWNDHTQVALMVNTRQLKRLKGRTLSFAVHSSTQVLTYQLPKGPITGIVTTRGGRRTDQALEVARAENWIPERGLRLRFGEPPIPGQLPTAENPSFIGTWNPDTTPRTLTIGTTAYEISLKKGGQSKALLFGVITTRDCRPFVNRATILGIRKGDVIVANEIHVLPIGDQAALDVPGLPRYLFIGDSISGNYTRGLRDALKGTFNLHHPPTNCGPSKSGKTNIVEWLGAYRQPRRGWDVISFNFGHWDAGNDKTSYQSNLEAVIAELEKTAAKLIWVTTCPVPDGFPPAGELTSQGKAPRRTSGVMRKYLNPWAMEVIRRHPKITVCDQWTFVRDQKDDLYSKWWAGKNVHFRGEEAAAFGRLLADHVRRVAR
jgi:hypothetical protein